MPPPEFGPDRPRAPGPAVRPPATCQVRTLQPLCTWPSRAVLQEQRCMIDEQLWILEQGPAARIGIQDQLFRYVDVRPGRPKHSVSVRGKAEREIASRATAGASDCGGACLRC